MKKLLSILIITCCIKTVAQKQIDYKVVNTYHIASAGGWDYIAINDGKLYVSHGTQVNVLTGETGDSIGVITNTMGVHGIAFSNVLNRGYTSNGRTNNVTVFDLKTNQLITQVATGENPDAIFYEPFSKTIITCNGRGKSLSVIDPESNTVVSTVDVGGKPEAAVYDGKGTVFVNVEDKNEIVVVDMKSRSVLHRWPLSPGEAPTGLAYDKETQRLFAGCEKLLVVVNANNGEIVDKITIGDGCDGVAFDNRSKNIFTSNGEGTLSVIKEDTPDKYTIVGNYTSKRGARTIAFDEKTGRIFLPTADFEAPAKQGERPRMVPGTFQVLVMQAAN